CAERCTSGSEGGRAMFSLRPCRPTLPDQIDGLPAHYYPAIEEPTPMDPSAHQAEIDRFFEAIPADVRHGGDQAYFAPTLDIIQMPHQRTFRTMDHYASVRAHETTHWAGGSRRLARTFGKRFGDKAYSFEELVAEIGSGLVCAHLGLPNELHDSHASYVGHWLGILRGDKTAIIHAASKAEQAFNYMLAFGADPALAPQAMSSAEADVLLAEAA
ncbi:zincin-like metallopeptidase domain-containing protein, partial [Sphingomonas sp. H39-1-10]|uniref:ArdC family protein n=1 Tax=Sphingomonas pollutisoli TaxID=3030829 RepID=UPI0023B9ACC4